MMSKILNTIYILKDKCDRLVLSWSQQLRKIIRRMFMSALNVDLYTLLSRRANTSFIEAALSSLDHLQGQLRLLI